MRASRPSVLSTEVTNVECATCFGPTRRRKLQSLNSRHADLTGLCPVDRSQLHFGVLPNEIFGCFIKVRKRPALQPRRR